MNLPEEIARLEAMHRELLGLAQGCLRILQEERFDDLDEAWAKRGRVFERIEAASRRLAPSFGEWASASAALTPDQRNQAGRLIDSIRQTGGKVLALDKEIATLIEKHQASLASEIKRIDNGKQLINAYSTSALKGPMKISKMG